MIRFFFFLFDFISDFFFLFQKESSRAGKRNAAESRKLFKLANDAPPHGKKAPPSPWTEFFM